MAFVCGETHPFSVNHSRILPLEAVNDKAIAHAAMAFDLRGAADGTRTRNRQLGRLLLYQLNYRRRCKDNFYQSEGPFRNCPTPVRSRIRTMPQTV